MHLPTYRWSGLAVSLIASTLALSGCGGMQQQSPHSVAENHKNSAASKSASVAKRTSGLPPARSGRGGYYMDDGPGDSDPDGLEVMPDAEPRIEPYSRAAGRPYVIFGKTYTPITDNRPLKQRGRGSWYGRKFHGQKTSNGEIYDMYQMTAAHPTLPLPSYVRVTNLSNGRQVIVRVNDRGPFLAGRIIDLSYTAALKLGYIKQGSAELEVERLLPDEIERMARNRRNAASNNQLAANGSGDEVSPVAVTASAASRMPEPASANGSAPLSVVDLGTGYYLQLGAYVQQANAEAIRHRMREDWSPNLPPLDVVQQGSLHRIYSGPFATRSEAEAAALQLQAAGTAKPLIVQR